MARAITGKVTSDKADKTIVVTVARRHTHPLYKKQYTRNTKYMAHDPNNEAKIGDTVIIKETRPISTRKHFILDKISEKGAVVFTSEDAEAGVEEFVKPKEKPAKEEVAEKPEAKAKPAVKPKAAAKTEAKE